MRRFAFASALLLCIGTLVATAASALDGKSPRAYIQGDFSARFVPDLHLLLIAVDGAGAVGDAGTHLAQLPGGLPGDGFVEGVVRFGVLATAAPNWRERTFHGAQLREYVDRFVLQSADGETLQWVLLAPSPSQAPCGPEAGCFVIDSIGVRHGGEAQPAARLLDLGERAARQFRLQALTATQASASPPCIADWGRGARSVAVDGRCRPGVPVRPMGSLSSSHLQPPLSQSR